MLNWYPGHMNKAINEIKQKLKIIDLIIEVVDARCPISSSHPLIKTINNKMIVRVINKSDLITKNSILKWEEYFKSLKKCVVFFNYKLNKSILINKINQIYKMYKEKQSRKQIVNPSMNILIIGIPNIGKSTIIKILTKRKNVRIANSPGWTKGLQWFTLSNSIKVMDSPGILWPRLDDKLKNIKLIIINSINFKIINSNNEYYFNNIIDWLITYYPKYFDKYDVGIKLNIDNIKIALIKYNNIVNNQNNIYTNFIIELQHNTKFFILLEDIKENIVNYKPINFDDK